MRELFNKGSTTFVVVQFVLRISFQFEVTPPPSQHAFSVVEHAQNKLDLFVLKSLLMVTGRRSIAHLLVSCTMIKWCLYTVT